MWPSLPVANHIADVANIFFIGSLVVGVAATVLIVWMSGVKEAYWEKDRTESAERVASLTAQGDQLRKDTAEANERAVQAALALEKFKAPRTIVPEQGARIIAAVKGFAGTSFDMAVIQGDPEATYFLRQLANILGTASWTWVEFNHPSGPFMTVAKFPDTPNFGYLARLGISIEMHSEKAAEFSGAAKALADALNAEGITAATGNEPTQDIPNHDAMHIIVGKKFP
jgi:hypothetical protein